MPTYCFDFFGTGPSHKEGGRNTGLTIDSHAVHRSRHQKLRSVTVLHLRDNRHTCEHGRNPQHHPTNSRTFLHLLLFTGKRQLHGHDKPLRLTVNLQKPFTTIHDSTLTHIHRHSQLHEQEA